MGGAKIVNGAGGLSTWATGFTTGSAKTAGAFWRLIGEAGGLQKWESKAAQSPAPARNPHPEYLGPVMKPPAKVPAAKGRKPSDLLLGYDVDRMNGLEARYAGHLEAQPGPRM